MEENERFITLSDVEKELAKYGFYGLTAHKGDDGRITYKYHSIAYYSIKDVTVTIAKLEREKIVIDMTINGMHVASSEELSRTLSGLRKVHYNNIKNYEERKKWDKDSGGGHYNRHKRMQFRNGNAWKNKAIEKTNKTIS